MLADKITLLAGPPPSSPSKLPSHYYEDLEDPRDDSTRATDNLRSSGIGFSTPSQNSQRNQLRVSSGGLSKIREKSGPKFNLDQDSLVKKHEDEFKYIYDEESADGLPSLDYLNLEHDQNPVSKFNIGTIGSLDEIDEHEEL